ncbi:P12 family lipoprotein [Borreliella burgdorferi]|uniref:P12 family lipoprotein n=3 Tax=Borreliella burgdorferi TaxID=139 RepID=UPI00017F43BC|nr:P12 family lipoprotein [Borreliella burgdorferi]EEF83102.1 putative lipoprotein [Borreliella burgdorferi CA-11.2A]MCD2387326.1 P12 family lipoprotein [Borreliella burgdorferi]
MKKKKLSIYMIMLISLLSCNTSDPNELTRKKMQDKNVKILGFLEKIQADNKEIVEKHIEKKEKQMVQAASVAPINVERNFPYYLQEEIEIKEEELVPNTDEEKKAEKAISNGSFEFAKLVDDENKLKNESVQLESSFNNVYKEILELADLIQAEVHVAGRINSYIKKRKTTKEKEYKKREIKNKIEKQALIKLFNQLLEKRGDIENLHTQLNSGLSERASAKYFFEKAKETLKAAITERLNNKRKNRPWWARRTHSNLAIQAKNEAEDALNQLSTSSFRILEAMKIKEDVKQLLEEVKSFLDSSKSKIFSSGDRLYDFLETSK